MRLRERLAWFEHRPLFGKRVGITRADEQADAQIDQLLELGAEPVLMPTLEIEPPESWESVDQVLARLGEFAWLVFTSSNGVRSLLGRLWDTNGDARRLGKLRLAAIGPSDWTGATCIPGPSTAASIPKQALGTGRPAPV